MNKISVLNEINTRKTNPEKLILAVKKHPSIWSSSCPEYKIKKTKQEAWNAVASEVIHGWKDFTRTEKHLTMRFIIRRWNNIRDYYNKSLKASCRAKLSGESCTKKKYVFADALRFLRPELKKNMTLPIRDLDSSLENLKVESLQSEEEEDTQEVVDEEEEAEYVTFVDSFDNIFDESNNGPSNKKQEQTLEYEEVVHESTKQEDDADVMFLKSLLPDMKKLADDEKFAFKYAIMQAYMDILKKRN